MTDNKKFVERQFEEVQGGYYDDYGFYYTPNGSFWDDKGYYFNSKGEDKHGGHYNDNFTYVPGQNWDKLNQCYLTEVDNYDYLEDEYDDVDDYDDFDKAGFENFKKANREDDYDLDDYGIEDSYIEKKPQTTSVFTATQTTLPTQINQSLTNDKDIKQKLPEKQITVESDKKSEPARVKKNKLDSLFDNSGPSKTVVITKAVNTNTKLNTSKKTK